MGNTSKLPVVSERDIAYYQRRNQNRLFEALTSFFAEEAERRNISKRDISDAIRRDPASITRLLSTPGNITADTISSFLLSLEAEMDYRIVRFSERSPANEMHPLIAKLKPHESVVEYNPPQQQLVQPYQRLAKPESNTAVLELSTQ